MLGAHDPPRAQRLRWRCAVGGPCGWAGDEDHRAMWARHGARFNLLAGVCVHWLLQLLFCTLRRILAYPSAHALRTNVPGSLPLAITAGRRAEAPPPTRTTLASRPAPS